MEGFSLNSPLNVPVLPTLYLSINTSTHTQELEGSTQRRLPSGPLCHPSSPCPSKPPISLGSQPPLRGLKFVIRALHPLDVIHYEPVIQGDPPRPGISHSQQSASRLTAHLPHNSFHLRPQSLAFHTKWCSCLNLNLMSQCLG